MTRGPRLWEEAFFEVLPRVAGRIKVAAERAGVTRDAVYKSARRDPAIAERIQDARRRIAESRRDRAVGRPPDESS